MGSGSPAVFDMQLWTAFLIGIAGSLHCAGMCGPLVLALARSRPPASGPCAGPVVYHLGRVASYSVLGLLLGLFGHFAVLGGFQRWLSIALGLALLAGLLIPTKARLLAALFHWIGLLQRLMRGILPRDSLGAQAAMGAINGLLPCGLVYVAAAGAMANAHPFASAVYMAVFGVGTWPLMLGIHITGSRVPLPSRLSWSSVHRAAMVAMAVLLVLRGLELGIPFVSPGPAAGVGGEPCH